MAAIPYCARTSDLVAKSLPVTLSWEHSNKGVKRNVIMQVKTLIGSFIFANIIKSGYYLAIATFFSSGGIFSIAYLSEVLGIVAFLETT